MFFIVLKLPSVVPAIVVNCVLHIIQLISNSLSETLWRNRGGNLTTTMENNLRNSRSSTQQKCISNIRFCKGSINFHALKIPFCNEALIFYCRRYVSQKMKFKNTAHCLSLFSVSSSFLFTRHSSAKQEK